MSGYAVLCFTKAGGEVAKRVAAALPEAQIYGSRRAVQTGIRPFASVYEQTAALFPAVEGLVFVGACGIAVRAIAPHVRDKRRDPAVLVVDERGQFVISLLSGHVGGGNALARRVAAAIGAVPVITTATDLNDKFAVDLFAQANRLHWEDKALAKEISAAVLAGEPVGFASDYPTVGEPPPFSADAPLGILVSHQKAQPFAHTLWLFPANLVLGVGCKRGAMQEQIEAAAAAALGSAGLSLDRVSEVRSIDKKRDETGLLAFCACHRLPAMFYSPAELLAVPGDFSGSAFVESAVGVDNVCERSAALGGNRLLVKKTACYGVTIAVAEKQITLEF